MVFENRRTFKSNPEEALCISEIPGRFGIPVAPVNPEFYYRGERSIDLCSHVADYGRSYDKASQVRGEVIQAYWLVRGFSEAT